ncbi:hypothetical protein RFI_39414, partial [Reticulomyxa filosa]
EELNSNLSMSMPLEQSVVVTDIMKDSRVETKCPSEKLFIDLEKVDTKTLKSVLLDACGVTMESAIETLLSSVFSGGNGKEKEGTNQWEVSEESQQSNTFICEVLESSNGSSPLIKPRINLSHDFLRPPGYFFKKYANETGFNHDQQVD